MFWAHSWTTFLFKDSVAPVLISAGVCLEAYNIKQSRGAKFLNFHLAITYMTSNGLVFDHWIRQAKSWSVNLL